MLHIWVGRAGSGKSRRVLEAMEKNRRLRRQVLGQGETEGVPWDPRRPGTRRC